MQIIKHPARKEWSQYLQRPAIDLSSLEQIVSGILAEVRLHGDEAVRKFTLQFDKAVIEDIMITGDQVAAAEKVLSHELKEAILVAKSNIEAFHQQQQAHVEIIETMPGVKCWRKNVAIEKVGLYIPGGTAPLFSTILMLGIPAKIAGCSEIILCSPPNTEGHLHPAILYVANLVGVTKIFRAGGVQAIAAMTYGTESIPRVYKIFGPGNQYVMYAKQLVQKDGMAIDMPAGPSEVAVFADETADVSFVAADLLSQAEHGVDSQVILVVNDESIVSQVEMELEKQLAKLPRKNIAARALENSKIFIVDSENEAIDLLNAYAPEHLILACRNADTLADRIVNAGSVFLGHYSPESAGDYASGTNHTLPTNGYARAYSGVSVDSFIKKITYQQLSKEGLNCIGKSVVAMAEAEGLLGHANAVRARIGNL